jgi:hypothetical protein
VSSKRITLILRDKQREERDRLLAASDMFLLFPEAQFTPVPEKS